MTTYGKSYWRRVTGWSFWRQKRDYAKVSTIRTSLSSGTLSGNPVAVAAGLKTLELIQKPNFYQQLSLMTKDLVDGMTEAARKMVLNFLLEV